MNPEDLLPSNALQIAITFGVIERVVAESFGMSPAALKVVTREPHYVWPRQIAMWLMRKRTNAPYMTIARHFGKDHGTVIYAERRVQDMLDSYPKVKRELLAIEEKVNDEQLSLRKATVDERAADLPGSEPPLLRNSETGERIL